MYLPNTLHTKYNGKGTSLPYLRCALFILEQLLQYHDKELYYHLRHCKISLEMFATSWVLTIFTRIIEFSLVYELWEIFLFERDKFLIFYFAVAILKHHRARIMEQSQFEKLLRYLTQEMRIRDFGQLAQVYEECLRVRA